MPFNSSVSKLLEMNCDEQAKRSRQRADILGSVKVQSS